MAEPEELTQLHSLVTMFKIIRFETPRNLSLKLEIDQHDFISTSRPRLKCTETNFRHRTTYLWNQLPAEVRGIRELKRFKIETKSWIVKKRPRNPD